MKIKTKRAKVHCRNFLSFEEWVGHTDLPCNEAKAEAEFLASIGRAPFPEKPIRRRAIPLQVVRREKSSKAK